MKKTKRKASSPTPVIAVRVSELLHLRIMTAAAQSGRSMSEEMAWLLENGFQWQQALGDRNKMLEQARQLLHEATENAKRISQEALELGMRQQNWRELHDGIGGVWVSPKRHGLPPNGFISPEALAEKVEHPAKKRKAS